MTIIHPIIAGAIGGVINSLAIWLFGLLGISQAFGFQMAPELSMDWLLPRLLPSALWGLLFLLPFWRERLFLKGALLSLVPLALMLLVIFPKMGAGMFGLELGRTAPVFALFFTQLWGLGAASWLDVASER